MLHLVSDSAEESLKNWCISRSRFLVLLDHLEANDFQTTHFAHSIEQGKARPSQKQVILTFDDCIKGLLDFAVPELIKRKMKAAFYMPTAYIGKYNAWDVAKGSEKLELMNEADLKDLAAVGMEIGSHSHTHPELKNISVEQQKQEVTISKQTIESITGKPVYSFAYPFGSVPLDYKSLLREAEYQYGVSIYQPFETALALRRFGVYEKDTAQTLAKKLSGGYKWMRKVYDVVKKY
jgi:peptidoglycan/xylan/chitin deacetylase (PgdA/CDA1 family)